MDLEWAAATGTKSTVYTHWYPSFETVTGVTLDDAGTEDVQLYWNCEGLNPNNRCGGLERPCGRSCLGSSGFTDDGQEVDSDVSDDWVWILISATMALCIVLCGAMLFCVWRRKNKAEFSVGGDGVSMRDDQQLRAVNTQMIELEDSVERQDGAVPTVMEMAV